MSEIINEMYLFRANRDDLDLIEYVYSETDNSTINSPEAYRMALEAELMCCQWLRMAGLKTNWVNGDYTRDMICAGFDIDVKHRTIKTKVHPTSYWPIAARSLEAQSASIKLFCATTQTESVDGYSDWLIQMVGWVLPTDIKDYGIIKTGELTPGNVVATYDMMCIFSAQMRSPHELITYLEVQSARKTFAS